MNDILHHLLPQGLLRETLLAAVFGVGPMITAFKYFHQFLYLLFEIRNTNGYSIHSIAMVLLFTYIQYT